MLCCCRTSSRKTSYNLVQDDNFAKPENGLTEHKVPEIKKDELSAGVSYVVPEVDTRLAETIPAREYRDQEQIELEIEEEEEMSAEQLGSAINRLESVASRLEQIAVSGGGSAKPTGGKPASSESTCPFVLQYDALLKGSFAKCVALGAQIGSEVADAMKNVASAFQAQREFLVKVSQSRQPTKPEDFAAMLKPTSDMIAAIQSFREKNRGSKQFNHLSTLSEAIPALGWVTMAPTPSPYVKEMKEAGMFYSNRVLKDFKDSNQTHCDWAKSWIATLNELQEYVKQHHTTGLVWNPQGVDAASLPASSPGGAPGPPPPPGLPPPAAAPGAPAPDGSALMASINTGGDVTKGLKKVTDNQKTHKNPTLREGPAPFKPQKPMKSVAAPVTKAIEVVKPPVTELQGKKWIVEHHKGNRRIVISAERKQAVYVFKCVDSVIQVKGKVSSIILDNCKKTAVVFEDVIVSCEFINCQSVQGQVTGKVPTIGIDKTDGCMIYLSNESLHTEIITAKSSEINILLPRPSGDYAEFALPEQFKSTWNDKSQTFVTESTDINK